MFCHFGSRVSFSLLVVALLCRQERLQMRVCRIRARLGGRHHGIVLRSEDAALLDHAQAEPLAEVYAHSTPIEKCFMPASKSTTPMFSRRVACIRESGKNVGLHKQSKNQLFTDNRCDTHPPSKKDNRTNTHPTSTRNPEGRGDQVHTRIIGHSQSSWTFRKDNSAHSLNSLHNHIELITSDSQ